MLIGAIAHYFFGITITVLSIFLILLVLVQRGRGGGLTGALGGPGGQSAFGTKAGDVFTRITVGVAAAWIFLCGCAVFFLKTGGLPQTNVTRQQATSSASGIGGGSEASNGTTESTDNAALEVPNTSSNDTSADSSPETTSSPETESANNTADSTEEASGTNTPDSEGSTTNSSDTPDVSTP
ncbi:MAG: preprotein translocase subunit SecG [Planctomycetales bacterium]|nr:preprotein translocase subunit SecG [Planctomycetales bacterium]